MKFEDLIKEKLKGHEYDYSPDQWKNMKKLLDKHKPANIFTRFSTFTNIFIGLTTIATIGVIAFILTDNNNDIQTGNTEFKDNNITLNNYEEKISGVDNKDVQILVDINKGDKAVSQPVGNKPVHAKINESMNLSKELFIDIDVETLKFIDPKKPYILVDECLPIKVVFADKGNDFYFIPNPKHKIYSLPEPGKEKMKIEVHHTEQVEKKPIDKPSKRVFNNRKSFLELFGFKR